MSIKDQLKNGTKDFGLAKGGDMFYQFQEGDNKMRVLTEGAVIGYHYFGKGSKPHVCYGISQGCPLHENDVDQKVQNVSTKYVSYVLDKRDGKVKIADLTYTVANKIAELQEDEDWKFESFPMPYEIKVVFKSDAAPSAKYNVLCAPAKTPVDSAVLGILAEKMSKMTPEQHVQKKAERQLEDDKEEGVWLSPEVRKARYEKLGGSLVKEDIPTIEYPTEDSSQVAF